MIKRGDLVVLSKTGNNFRSLDDKSLGICLGDVDSQLKGMLEVYWLKGVGKRIMWHGYIEKLDKNT